MTVEPPRHLSELIAIGPSVGQVIYAAFASVTLLENLGLADTSPAIDHHESRPRTAPFVLQKLELSLPVDEIHLSTLK